MALLEAFNAICGNEPAAHEDHPRLSDNRKRLRWMIQNPGADLTKRMVITPEIATVMMERNADDEWRNRPHSEKGLRRYIASMKRGWRLTGEPIIFSKSGRLINGQHRLMACIASECSFECLVVCGIDDDAFKFVDIGISRTAAHIFSIEDIPNANLVSAAARLLFAYKRSQSWDGSSPDVENDTLLDFYRHHDRLQDAIATARPMFRAKLMVSRWAVFCAYICREKSAKDAEDFFEVASSGFGASSKKSPEYLIYKTLNENAKSPAKKLSDSYTGAYLIQAWNAYRHNRTIGVFRWRTEQAPTLAFPRAE